MVQWRRQCNFAVTGVHKLPEVYKWRVGSCGVKKGLWKKGIY